jgi:transcriptional regulator with XRE-family HTH domain
MAQTKTKSPSNLGALIRKRRKQLDLTLQALCDDAGLSVGYLSQVERGQATPSLGTLAQIAHGLNVGLEYFIVSHRPADSLTRAGARPQFSIDGSTLMYEAISTGLPGAEISSYLLHVPPGSSKVPSPKPWVANALSYKQGTACITSVQPPIRGPMRPNPSRAFFGPARCPCSNKKAQ